MRPAGLRQALRRRLPAQLTEVLLPTSQWRATARRITAVLPNPIWENLFRDYCEDEARQLLAQRDMKLHVICQDMDEDPTQTRQPSFLSQSPASPPSPTLPPRRWARPCQGRPLGRHRGAVWTLDTAETIDQHGLGVGGLDPNDGSRCQTPLRVGSTHTRS